MFAALGIVLALLLTGGGAAVLAQGYFADDTAAGAIAPAPIMPESSSSSQSSSESSNESSEQSSSLSSEQSSEQTSSQSSQAVEPAPVVYELQPIATSGSTKVIRIFLKSQMAYLLENGVVVKTYRISSGAPRTPTPTGNFQIYKKQPLRVSSLEVPYRMPNYMAFTENEAFGLHGLPYLGRAPEESAYWHEARSHIGIPVSHGCIRFLPEEAAEIYQWVDVGTQVFIRS